MYHTYNPVTLLFLAAMACAEPDVAIPGYRVHRIDVGSNAYLIEAESTLVLVDAGYPGRAKKILRGISSLKPKELVLIFLTHGHFDHYGSAGKVREVTGADIGVHVLDSSAVVNGKTPIKKTRNGGAFGRMVLPLAHRLLRHKGAEVDTTFRHGDSLRGYGVDAAVVHTPGHTAGSCSLLLSGRVLFSGDLISTARGVQKQKWYANDWARIDTSLAAIKQLHPAILCPGHGRRLLTSDDIKGL